MNLLNRRSFFSALGIGLAAPVAVQAAKPLVKARRNCRHEVKWNKHDCCYAAVGWHQVESAPSEAIEDMSGNYTIYFDHCLALAPGDTLHISTTGTNLHKID